MVFTLISGSISDFALSIGDFSALIGVSRTSNGDSPKFPGDLIRL